MILRYCFYIGNIHNFILRLSPFSFLYHRHRRCHRPILSKQIIRTIISCTPLRLLLVRRWHRFQNNEELKIGLISCLGFPFYFSSSKYPHQPQKPFSAECSHFYDKSHVPCAHHTPIVSNISAQHPDIPMHTTFLSACSSHLPLCCSACDTCCPFFFFRCWLVVF